MLKWPGHCLILILFLCTTFAIAQSPNISSTHKRILSRSYPSVFQAWNPAQNLKAEDKLVTMARHDLVFHALDYFKLYWKHKHHGLADQFYEGNIESALKHKTKLLQLNPNLIMIAELRYRDAHQSHLPENHSWWKRDELGKRVVGWAEGGYFLLDFSNPDFQDHIAKQAAVVIKSGVLDGIMLDWWTENDKAALPDRLALLKKIRNAIGQDALILVNSNDRPIPKSAAMVNGLFMECWQSREKSNWKTMSNTLIWAEQNLKQPRINCIEAWYKKSRKDLHLMRAVTTLSLTQSDGYCLFSDPNDLPTGDHLHDWYPFWNKSLGKPVSKGKARQSGVWIRQFQNGTVIYNPPDNKPYVINFNNPKKQLSTGNIGMQFMVQPWDGDIFITVK